MSDEQTNSPCLPGRYCIQSFDGSLEVAAIKVIGEAFIALLSEDTPAIQPGVGKRIGRELREAYATFLMGSEEKADA